MKEKNLINNLIMFSNIKRMITKDEIHSMVTSCKDMGTSFDTLYTVYKVKKKSGGHRIITVPDSRLKEVQRVISSVFERAIVLMDNKEQKYVLSDHQEYTFRSGDSSFGFEKNKNIMMNATMHAHHEYLFKTDISKFFDSFDVGMVKRTVHKAMKLNSDSLYKRRTLRKFTKEQKEYASCALDIFNIKWRKKEFYYENLLTALLCYKGKLATGSPASPALANLYMRPFDVGMNVFLKDVEIKTGQEFTYTRYADDIVISSNKPIPKYVKKHLKHRLQKFGLTMNESKTVCQSNKRKNVVTGINITPEGKLTVGRKKKEEIKKMMYHFYILKDGKYSFSEVHGNIKYLQQVEPDYAEKVVRKYIITYH